MYIRKLLLGGSGLKNANSEAKLSFSGIYPFFCLALYTEACKRMIVCSSTELGCFKDCILSRVTLEDYTRRVSTSRWLWMVLKIGALKFLCPIWYTGTVVIFSIGKNSGMHRSWTQKTCPFFGGLVIFKKGERATILVPGVGPSRFCRAKCCDVWNKEASWDVDCWGIIRVTPTWWIYWIYLERPNPGKFQGGAQYLGFSQNVPSWNHTSAGNVPKM